MIRFQLVRHEDESGVSGTGIVAQGVEFDDGQVVMHWLGDIKSTTMYQSIGDIHKIHGHDGKTIVDWID